MRLSGLEIPAPELLRARTFGLLFAYRRIEVLYIPITSDLREHESDIIAAARLA